MITNFDERIKFIDCIFPLQSTYFVDIFYLRFLPEMNYGGFKLLYDLRFYVNYDLLPHNCLLLLMHNLNKSNSLWLYVKLDPFMKKLHIIQLEIISYFWQIVFYRSVIVLWRFNMIEILFDLIFILFLFVVTKVTKL